MFEPVIKAKGLYTNPNPFSVSPEGSLLKADNVVIDEDGTIRSRRGQELISGAATLISGSFVDYRAQKCWWYNNRIWVHFTGPVVSNNANAFAFWDWGGSWIVPGNQPTQATSLAIDTSGKIKIRQTEANKRQLITTSKGIYRTETGTASTNTQFESAGVPKGIDIRFTAIAVAGTIDPMPAFSVWAYRAVWRCTDTNKIIRIGAPSGKCTAKNDNSAARTPTIQVGIPMNGAVSGKATYLQIYRTQSFARMPNLQYPDVGEEFYLCTEITPTAADFTANYVSYTDIVTDALLGEPLYTNANQLGAAQANDVPPASKDVTYFNDTGFYLNTVSKQRMIFSILAVNSTLVPGNVGLTVGDVIQVGDLAMLAVDGGTTGLPIAAESLNGPTYWAFAVDRSTGAGSEVTRVLKTTESFCYKYNLWSNVCGGRYYAYNITSADDIVGRVLIEEKMINGSVKAYFSTNRLDSPPGYIPTPVADTTSTVGLSRSLTAVTVAGATTTFTYTINHGYSIGDTIFFSWFADWVGGTITTEVPPGVYVVTGTPAANQVTVASPTGAVNNTDNALPIVAYTHLVIENATSSSDAAANRVMYSALQEPEAVPLLNRFDLGRVDAEGLVMQRLGQSLFVFKEDGLFRITGTWGSFVADEFDPTVRLLAPESVQVVNNSIYCLTDQGVVRITETGANVISREIENDIFAAIAANISITRKEAFGIGYEDDRKYILWMPTTASSTKPDQAFVYNVFTKAWTKRTDQANCGLTGRRNDVLTDIQKLYTIKDRTSSWLTQERKTNSVKDYVDESKDFFSTFTGQADGLIQFSASDAYFFEAGTLWVGDADPRYKGIQIDLSGNNPIIEYLGNETNSVAQTNPATWTIASSIVAYKSIPISVSYNHFIGEDVSARKSYSEIYLTFDKPYFTKSVLNFTTDTYPTATSVNMWGYGYNFYNSGFPWAIKTYTGALLGRTLRALIPTNSTKCSQLIFNITHQRGWENFSIRGVSMRYSGGSKNVQRDNA